MQLAGKPSRFRETAASPWDRYGTLLGVRLLSLTASARTVYYASDYGDATVFRDIHPNGVQDADEPPVKTDPVTGRFPRPKGHGRLYLYGGKEILTGRENTLLLSAPDGFKGTGILTTLYQALRDRKLPPAKIRKLLFLPSSPAGYAPDPEKQKNPRHKPRKLVQRNAQQNALVNFIKPLIRKKPATAPPQKPVPLAQSDPSYQEDDAVKAVADAIQQWSQSNSRLDLTDPQAVQSVVGSSLGTLNPDVTADQVQIIARATATKLNAVFEKAGRSGTARSFADLSNDRAKGAEFLAADQFADFVSFFFGAPQITANPPTNQKYTNDTTPTWSGTIVLGAASKIQVYRDGISLGDKGQVVPDDQGNWSYTSPQLTTHGTYTFAFTAVTIFGFERRHISPIHSNPRYETALCSLLSTVRP